MTTAERLLKVNEYVDKAESLNKELGQTLYCSNEKSSLDTNVHQAISDFNSVKDKFVENGVEVSDGTKTSEYADKVDEVYSVGKSDGYTEGQEAGYTKGKTDGHAEGVEYGYNSGYAEGASAGYAEGVEAGKAEGFTEGKAEGVEEGKKAEYDAFWDAFQQNGERNRYDYGFYRLSAGCFYPKYDIKPIGTTSYMMQYFNDKAQEPLDVAARLEACGVVLDTSLATNFNRGFYWTSGVSRLPPISFESATDVSYCFGTNSNLVTIDKIILPEDGLHASLIDAFAACEKLVNLTVQGTIGNNIYFTYCPLSVESMKSIIAHLANYAGTASESVYTVRFRSDRWSALEASGTAPNGGTWKDYVISLGWLT